MDPLLATCLSVGFQFLSFYQIKFPVIYNTYFFFFELSFLV